MPKHSICAEIGVWQGDFSKRILQVVAPKTLHLIDPWQFQSTYPHTWYGGGKARNQKDMDRIYERVVRAFAASNNVVIHRELSQAAAAQFEDNYFDWVYVDGNHHYDPVKQDLELYTRKVRPGGFICGDDYEWRVTDDYPVRRAVEDFVKTGLVEVAGVRSGNFILVKRL
jgi:hypothetical protein